MNKKLLTLLLLAPIGLLNPARATEPSVSVIDKDEGKSSIERSKVSRIYLNEEEVEIKLKDGTSLKFNKESISRILLGDTENAGIEETVRTNLTVYPLVTSDFLNINGCDDIEQYYLFDLNGHLCLSGTVTPEGKNISLSHLPAGLYLLVVENQTFKIVKK